MDLPASERWLNCLKEIKGNIPENLFTTWFAPIKFVSFENGELILGVPSSTFARCVEDQFAPVFSHALRAQYGERWRLKYVFPKDHQEAQPAPAAPAGANAAHAAQGAKPASTPQTLGKLPPLDPQLRPTYTFDNFVMGESNKLALSVGQSIARQPGSGSFNPFFLYGPSGVGKTHLVNAIGLDILRRDPQKRVLFVSAHLFKTQYTDSVLHNTSNDFLKFYQSIDVLMIDDIQEITTDKTQKAFFHIFNHLQQNGKQIIITCDQPPVLLKGIEDRMLTRFKWGMIAEMEKPDTRLRRDILTAKVKRDGLHFPPEVIQYIAQNVESSVRELEGIVNSVMAYSVVDNCEIDVALTQRVVARSVNLEKKDLTGDEITAAVLAHYGVKQRDIVSKSRKQGIVLARQVAMYLCHKYTGMPYGAVGKRFGGRDHATVIYACNQISRRISVDKPFRREMEELEAALK